MPTRLNDQIKWKGRAYDEKPSSRRKYLPPTLRAVSLHEHYKLERWSSFWTPETFEEVMGVLDLLDRVRSHCRTSEWRSVLEVGARNWRYLGALVSWLENGACPEGAVVRGVELDAYRLYADLRTRVSYAEYFRSTCAQLVERFDLRFVPVDIRDVRARANGVIWLFPYLFEDTHERGGLPLKTFDPEGVAQHVCQELLEDQGQLVMVNQGAWEWRAAQEIMGSQLKLDFVEEIRGSLHASTHPLFLSVWTKLQTGKLLDSR